MMSIQKHPSTNLRRDAVSRGARRARAAGLTQRGRAGRAGPHQLSTMLLTASSAAHVSFSKESAHGTCRTVSASSGPVSQLRLQRAPVDCCCSLLLHTQPARPPSPLNWSKIQGGGVQIKRITTQMSQPRRAVEKG
jgi:hypothetical protein